MPRENFQILPNKKNVHTHVDQSITKIWCCGGKKKNSLWTNDLSSIDSLCLSDDSMHKLARFVFSLLKIQWYLTYNGNVYSIKTKFKGTSHRCFFKNLYRISNVHTTKSSKTCDCIYKYGIYINPYIFFFNVMKHIS